MVPQVRLACLMIWAVLCLAQDPGALFEKAPPEIDEALRARVTTFYQAHVDGKFRAADALVEEDSKDIFFAIEKPRCRSFAIGNVTYAENFTRAKVMIACDTDMMMMMAGRVSVKLPVQSLWKYVSGQWFWYSEPLADKEVQTPFGVHKPAQVEENSNSAALPGKFIDLSTVTSLVKADKSDVKLSASEPGSDKVVLTSRLPGVANLSLRGNPSVGLSYKLDRTTINVGESAVLTVDYQPVKGRLASATVVSVVVEPTGQEITINIGFSKAPTRTSSK